MPTPCQSVALSSASERGGCTRLANLAAAAAAAGLHLMMSRPSFTTILDLESMVEAGWPRGGLKCLKERRKKKDRKDLPSGMGNVGEEEENIKCRAREKKGKRKSRRRGSKAYLETEG